MFNGIIDFNGKMQTKTSTFHTWPFDTFYWISTFANKINLKNMSLQSLSRNFISNVLVREEGRTKHSFIYVQCPITQTYAKYFTYEKVLQLLLQVLREYPVKSDRTIALTQNDNKFLT